MRILVVEDDAQTAALVGQALRDDGHAVDVVADGREGLKQGAVNAYDVLVVDRMLPGLDGLSIVQSLRTKVKGKRVLLVRASVARDVIPRELRKAGAKVEVVDAYQTILPRASAAKIEAVLSDAKRRPHAITFTSSSTVRNFVKMAGRVSLQGVLLASIGPVTSATLRECGLKVGVQAGEYTMEGLVEALAGKLHTKGRKASRT